MRRDYEVPGMNLWATYREPWDLIISVNVSAYTGYDSNTLKLVVWNLWRW
jgi:hypothetical protein